MEWILMVLLLGILFLIGVIVQTVQDENTTLTRRLLIALIVVGGVFLVSGLWLIALLSIDAWFYSTWTLVIGYSPCFLGLTMILVGAITLARRKSRANGLSTKEDLPF